jgi:hypothetical protein
VAGLEAVIDRSGAAPRIQAVLPAGVRPRQLSVRTLLAGMCLARADGRPARLTRVHQALTALPEHDQVRPGVIADRKHGPHLLTCRQIERTFGLATAAPGKDAPGGLPAPALPAVCDGLLEASIPDQFKDAGTSLAADRADLESFSRPPVARNQRLRRPRSLVGPPQEQPAAQPGRAAFTGGTCPPGS